MRFYACIVLAPHISELFQTDQLFEDVLANLVAASAVGQLIPGLETGDVIINGGTHITDLLL